MKVWTGGKQSGFVALGFAPSSHISTYPPDLKVLHHVRLSGAR